MNHCRTGVIWAVTLILAPLANAQTKSALLIGIDTYLAPGAQPTQVRAPHSGGSSRFDLPNWSNLKGALNDVNLVRDLLCSSKFGFPGDSGHMHLITQAQATREGILNAMRKYLVKEPAPGDTVVLYYAGHGSQRFNSKTDKRLNQLDNTIVPSDARKGQFDVRDREIARILNEALDKGVRVTAIFDSCHSGTIGRGIPMGAAARARYLGYDPRDINEEPDTKNGASVPRPEDRSKNPALVFTATEANQLAKEWDYNGESHGAFTVALVEALRYLPADTPAIDVYKRVKVVMEGMGLVDQQPVLDSTDERKRASLFGTMLADAKMRVAVVKISEDGAVILDSGVVGDIGPGSELTKSGDKSDASVRIRVTRVNGLSRSEAVVVSPSNPKLSTGDLFEVAKWIPNADHQLEVWTPPATLSAEQLKNVVTEASVLSTAPQITWVSDPVVKAPDFMLAWNGAQWELTRQGDREKVLMGATLEAKSVLAKLPITKVALLLNLPPSRELNEKIKPGPTIPVAFTAQPSEAQYVLVGTYAHNSVAYSWVSREVLEQGRTAAGQNSQMVCSDSSPYPVRTDWIELAEDANQPGARLLAKSVQLARVHQWLELPLPPSESSAFPFGLVLKRDDGSLIEGSANGTEHASMFLRLNSQRQGGGARWVYVLDIDCEGHGTLLYPAPGVSNHLPEPGNSSAEIPLEHSKFRFSAPFGTDTMVLLTTNDQLPDPSLLNFAGVSSGGARGVPNASASPLEQLLREASGGTRGVIPAALPTDWGVQYLQIRTHGAELKRSNQ